MTPRWRVLTSGVGPGQSSKSYPQSEAKAKALFGRLYLAGICTWLELQRRDDGRWVTVDFRGHRLMATN